MIKRMFLAGLALILGIGEINTVGAAAPVVIFDHGHGQRFYADKNGELDLSSLAGLFREGGFEVKTSGEVISATLLSGIDGLVLSGAFKGFSKEEISVIVDFIEKGGKLSVMLHIGPPYSELLHALGIDHSNGVIREREGIIDNEPLNFRVSNLKEHDIMKGLDGFNVYGSWAVVNTDANSGLIAETGPKAWVDLDGNKTFSPADAVQRFGVVVAGRIGKGEFVVFGDDAIFQNRFLAGPNVHLGRNLVKWMKQ